MAKLTLDAITKSFGKTEVLKGIDLTVADGEFIVLLGPSGCGKSTLLRIVAGLETQTGGTVSIGDEVVDVVPPAKRGVGMVFQTYALYPHLDVAGNWSIGLKQAGLPRPQIEQRSGDAARMLELTDLLGRKPAELSGGQRQRVAIGRAIVRQPKVMLFDEPLSNLDAALRAQVRFEIGKLHQDLRTTIIYVTHDQIEAMTLADRIVVMHEGVVQQVGSPSDLYRTPQNLFVAGFIGSPKMNLLPGSVGSDGTVAITGAGSLGITGAGSLGITAAGGAGPVTVGVRPDGFETVDAAAAPITGTIALYEYLGRQSYLHVQLPGGDIVIVEVDADADHEPGHTVGLTVKHSAVHLFDAETGTRRAGP